MDVYLYSQLMYVDYFTPWRQYTQYTANVCLGLIGNTGSQLLTEIC